MEMLGPTAIVENLGQDSALRRASQFGKPRVPELAALSKASSFIEDSTHACGTDPSDQDEIPLPESMQSF